MTFFSFVGDHERLARGAHHHLVLGVLEITHADRVTIASRRQQRRLVDHIGQIGAGHAGRAAGHHRQIDIIRGLDLAGVNLENPFAPLDIGSGHHDLAVEATGPQKRRIEHVGTVGGGDQNDAFIRFETVHLDQQLIESLLAFVVTAAQTGAAMTPDSVDFIDENDARRVLLALLEQVADAARRRRRQTSRQNRSPTSRRTVRRLHPPRRGPEASCLFREDRARSAPLGILPPSFWNLPGSLRNSIIS